MAEDDWAISEIGKTIMRGLKKLAIEERLAVAIHDRLTYHDPYGRPDGSIPSKFELNVRVVVKTGSSKEDPNLNETTISAELEGMW